MSSNGTDAAAASESPSDWRQAAVAAHEGPLMLYAARLCGGVEPARDAVQETFLKLCQQRREDVESHLREWLFTVCRNRIFDTRRKERRMATFTQTAHAAIPAPAPAADPLETRELSRRVEAVLARLPEREEELLRLKFQHGLSYKEISRITRLSAGNVGFLIHTALKKTREQLALESAGK